MVIPLPAATSTSLVNRGGPAVQCCHLFSAEIIKIIA